MPPCCLHHHRGRYSSQCGLPLPPDHLFDSRRPTPYCPIIAITFKHHKHRFSFVTVFGPDKEIAPKSINDVKLINGGKILENNRTIAESRVPVGDLPGGVITMHVIVRPPVAEKNNEKQLAKTQKQHRCACTIL